MWQHFDHQADMGVRGIGRSREEAFEQAALALVAVTLAPETVLESQRVCVTCTGDDDELLLLDWLSAVVYQMSAYRMVFGRFVIHIEGQRLDGELWGEPLDLARHQVGVEVKAATATALRVERRPDGTWVAQCVVDV
jgi:SHS2 domain-containing protein